MPKTKILIADDNFNILEVIKMEFESMDYEVVTADDGEEALEKIYKEFPALIILDIMMPKLNGYEVCRRLKASPLTADIPVIMLTAKSQKEDKFWGRDAGADDYITKPFDPVELETLVEKLLRLRKRGESYHPLTKLPTQASILKEEERRKKEGLSFVKAMFSFPPDAIHVFKQKYGEMAWDEFLQAAANILKAALERFAPQDGFLGHRGDDVLVALMPPHLWPKFKAAGLEEVKRTLANYYKPEDLKRGYVAVGEAQYPLLIMEVSPE